MTKEPRRPPPLATPDDGPGGSDEPDVFDVAAGEAVVVRVHAHPGARRDEVGGRHGDALRVRVRAAADRGRANDAVVAALAAALGLPRAAVTLVSGPTSRAKRLRVEPEDGGRDRVTTALRTLARG